MKIKKQTSRFIRIVIDNFVVVTIVFSVLLVLAVAGFRMLGKDRQEIYMKVKVSQGLWWANTGRPYYWYVQAIKKGMVQNDFSGRQKAEIIGVRYYPFWDSSQYETFVTLKLLANNNKGEYIYDRNTLGAGAPIEFEFPTLQFTGTVIAISEIPFEQELIDKTIVLQKTYAYPWEYDALQVGEKYFDGEDDVFEILDKNRSVSSIPSQDVNKNLTGIQESRTTVTVKAKVKVKMENGQYIFGEEQVLRAGRVIQFALNTFQFSEYQVVSIK